MVIMLNGLLTFIGSKNSDVPVDRICSMIKCVHRAPVIEPDGNVVTFRSCGLQSGLIGTVQSCEDMMVQFACIRAELELCLSSGHWDMKQLGSLADDSTQAGDWDDHDSLIASRGHSFGITGLETDPLKTTVGTACHSINNF